MLGVSSVSSHGNCLASFKMLADSDLESRCPIAVAEAFQVSSQYCSRHDQGISRHQARQVSPESKGQGDQSEEKENQNGHLLLHRPGPFDPRRKNFNSSKIANELLVYRETISSIALGHQCTQRSYFDPRVGSAPLLQ